MKKSDTTLFGDTFKDIMGTDKAPQINHGYVVFVGSKGSGKSSLYQCLKSPNPQVMDGSNCSVLVEDWRPFSNESPSKLASLGHGGLALG